MIKVYNSAEKLFNHNGIKILKPTKCYIFKEDNGNYYIELEDSIDNIEYYQANMIITLPTPFPEGVQAFRLLNPEKKNNKLSVKGQHIYFDRANYIIADKYIVDRNCNYALDYLNSNTDIESPFTTSSNISTLNSYRCIRKSLQEADNTIIEKWGGHLVRNNFHVAINSTIGQDRGVILKYGKNIKDMSVNENWDNVVTKILPVGKDGLLLPELYLSISEELYDIPFTKVIPFNQDHIEQFENESDEDYQARLIADLREQGINHLNNNKYPKVNYNLSANLENITDVGDTVYVKHPKLKVDLITNIISVKYDAILKKYKNIEFGNYKNSLKNLFKDINSNIVNTVENISEETKTILEEELRQATIAIWNTLGASYVINEGDKILVLDRLPKEEAQNVMVINNGGIGFGNNGIYGTFNSAWTIDGTLDMQHINVINLVADMIQGGTLRVGGNNNSNGCIEIYDKDGNLINKIDKDGIQLKVNGEITSIENAINTTNTQTNSAIIIEDAGDNDLVSLTINPNGQSGAGTLNPETNKYEITVNICKQNIFDNDMELGFIDSTTGLNSDSTTRCRTKNYINVFKARKIAILSSDNTRYIKSLRLYDKSKNYLGYYSVTNNNVFDIDEIIIDGETEYYTSNDDIYYMRFIITDIGALEKTIGVMYNTTEYSEYVSNFKKYAFDNSIIDEIINIDLPKTYKGISYITIDDESQPNITVEYVKDIALSDYIENRYKQNKAELLITAEEISSTVATKVGENEIISKINQTAETIKIQASKIELTGYVTVTDLSTSGSTVINGSNITTGTINASLVSVTNISADNIKSGTITSAAVNLGNGTFKLTTTGSLQYYNSPGFLFCGGNTTNHPYVSALNVASQGSNLGGVSFRNSITRTDAGSEKARLAYSSTNDQLYMYTSTGNINVSSGNNYAIDSSGYLALRTSGYQSSGSGAIGTNSGSIYIYAGQHITLHAGSSSNTGKHVYVGNDGNGNNYVGIDSSGPSSRCLKTDISEFTNIEYEDALKLLNEIKLYDYKYKYNIHPKKEQFGFMIDDLLENKLANKFFYFKDEKAKITESNALDYLLETKDDEKKAISFKRYDEETLIKYLLVVCKALQNKISKLEVR